MTEEGLITDPIVIHVNDIVIWAFTTPQVNDLVLIDTETDWLRYSELSKDILPRRHLSYSFKEPGVYHFTCPSFDNTVDPSNIDSFKGLEVNRIQPNTYFLLFSKYFFII